MANIHILDGRHDTTVGTVVQGSFRVAFHIPLTNPIAGVVPTPGSPDAEGRGGSAVPNISVAERGAMDAGTLVEVVEMRNYNSNKTDASYRQQLKDRWTELSIQENIKFDFAYKYWLAEIVA